MYWPFIHSSFVSSNTASFFRDAVERELAAQHVAAYERRLAVEGPTQKGQEVHHRVGQEAAVAELLDARCAVALGELLPVGA